MPPKRRRRFQGLYYHSSPPKVLPMNGQISNENGRKRRDNDDFSVKLSTIRIWMHEKDIGKLTRILWAGQGQRLRQQASTNSKVKRFLTAVPHVMNSIKDVHQAVIDNSLETLQTKLEPPVPPALVTCRDANGLNLIHKAAGLGHATILEYLITTWPDGVHETDITGKTPLHWAASAKNNMRCYTLLTQAGCDEEAVDYKMKTPSFYRHKPHDIERAFLTYVPEAPRVSPDVPTDWEALSDDSGDGKKPDIKIPEMNGFSRHSNAESNENTSEAEMTEAVSGLEDEEMSKDDDDDGVAADDSEALIENAEEAAEATKDSEDPPAKEEEEPTETEPEQIEPEEEEKEEEDEEKESPVNNGDKEDEEEQKEETEEEPDKEEMDDKEAEEAQDEKLQTENETTTNPTKEAEAEHEIESKDEKAEEESKATTEQENKENSTSSKEKETKSAINADQENNKTETELKEDKKEEDEEEGDSKTVGETLEVIKDEVKENVKYLANKVKNIFNKNEEEEDETKNDEKKEDNQNDENITQTNEINGNKNEEDDKDENVAKEDDNKEEKVKSDGKELEENINSTEINKVGNNGNIEETSQEETIKKENLNKIESQTETKEALDKNSNDINDQAQKLTNSIVNSLESTTIETLKNENNKTEEDENNNKPKSIEVEETTNQKEPTDEDFEKINKSLEEYLDKEENNIKEKQQEFGDKLQDIGDSVKVSINEKQQEMGKLADNVTDSVKETKKELGDKLNEVTDSAKETKQELGEKLEEITDSVKETKQDLADKLDEITDNVKENVKDMANKVKNIFSSPSEDKLDNESNDIVLHSESPTKKLKKPKVESESSDETADEDEATQAEEANDGDDNVEPDANDADDEQADNDNAEETETDDRNGEESPTSSLAIEGFVQGESEDNQVQSQTAAYVHDDEDTRLQNIIASGDMEQLAQIVLNGDGQKLLNVEATEPEIQAFLKNVPNYMTKIRRVHEAARGGSLLNLQQALDRRKFAIAKDEISPNGATPLHVAVLFGHSDIVRYLSARFPETTTIADNDDRTALHYAAVIKDNGHFYNVLLQLGANPKVVDKMGHTPEEYLGNETLKETLNYGQLLKNFGAEELETQLLSDQGQIENHSFQENPIFKTEQGKYLADNLADPLIKALTQVAQKRPNDPLQYLTNYLQTYTTSQNSNGKTIIQAAIHSGSSQTNSTALVNSKPSTPPAATAQTARMNGHVKYDNTDEIEEDSIPQIDEYDEDDSDAAVSKRLEERDEHGQSMLHFASARSHRKGGLIHLIEEAKADITYRDELYRTARDVALQANQLGNAKEIDRYLISLAIVGDLKPFEHFAISGYDHIIDIVDDNETPIIDVTESKGHMELAEFLRTLRPLEELREELHQMIRDNNVERVKEIVNGPSGKWLIQAKNYYGRTALHIAILKESEEIVEYFIKLCPEASKIGDNLERTALHYAMATNIIESISRILIQNGSKRTHKDLKGRQPSYYFMNKADILRLQEEEDENR